MSNKKTPQNRVNTYEGMFLFPQSATGNLQAAVDHVTDLLKRADAELISLSKWDERRLAYEIKGNKRGVYFLAYFKAQRESLAGLERNCNLSEQLLRAMMTRADHVPGEVVSAADGREKLSDEIKLRGEEAEKAARSEPQQPEPTEPTATSTSV